MKNTVTITAVLQSGERFILQQELINPQSVRRVLPEPSLKQPLREGKFPENLNPNHSFCRIQFRSGESDMLVVGDVQTIQEKLNGTKTLLLG